MALYWPLASDQPSQSRMASATLFRSSSSVMFVTSVHGVLNPLALGAEIECDGDRVDGHEITVIWLVHAMKANTPVRASVTMLLTDMKFARRLMIFSFYYDSFQSSNRA